MSRKCECCGKDTDGIVIFCGECYSNAWNHYQPECNKLEAELAKWKENWLKVCKEGNVPQYEDIEIPYPEGILHGVRQLASMWSGEKLLREKLEKELAEAKTGRR